MQELVQEVWRIFTKGSPRSLAAKASTSMDVMMSASPFSSMSMLETDSCAYFISASMPASS